MITSAPRTFGVLADGREVTEYTLQNQFGIIVKILDYGGIIRVLEVPDRLGRPADIVLGFDELSGYEGAHPYFGAIVGRVAGRIRGGRLTIDGNRYPLSLNTPLNHIHGGTVGFDHKLWDADYCAESNSLTLCLESLAGDEGYPGTLVARVTYRLTNANDLEVEYHATTDAPTAVNLTQHSYFNLSGDPSGNVLGHTLTVQSERVLELDDSSIPTGRELDVANTDFDFRTPKKIGREVEGSPGRFDGDGFDHYWILSGGTDDSVLNAALEIHHEESGRLLQVATTAPGAQIYTGIDLPEKLIGKYGLLYRPQSGICIETQIHPDSPNRPEFPSILLGANETYQSTTVFSIRVF
jgi:aldose 1-epimerase|tara:strand:+ start:1819 stop:2877 length:1059 start_codon:yes stop_codon:yes gene_type:complete